MKLSLLPSQYSTHHITTVGTKSFTDFGVSYTSIPFSAVGDLTGDGLPEVVVAGWSFLGDLSYYSQPRSEFVVMSLSAQGQWQDITARFTKTPYVYGVGSVLISDFNQDGVNDVFFAPYMEQYPTGAVYALKASYLLSDHGQYRWAQGFTAISRDAHGASLADINQDGRMEVLIASYWNKPIDDPSSTQLQPGYFQFNASTQQFNYVEIPALYSVSGIAGGDVNGDGRTDVIATDQYFNSEADVIALLQNSHGSYPSDPTISSQVLAVGNGYFDVYPSLAGGVPSYASRTSHTTRAFLEDIDKDGDLDVLTTPQIFPGHGVSAAPKAATQVFENLGGRFQEATDKFILYQSCDHYGAYHLSFIDINHDGHKDIITYAHGAWASRVTATQLLINTGDNHYIEADPNLLGTYQASSFWSNPLQVSYVSQGVGTTIPIVTDAGLQFVIESEIYPGQQLNDKYSGMAWFSMDFGILYSGPAGINPAIYGAPGFSEAYYLSQHADVVAAVDAGLYESGLAHYLIKGKALGYAGFAHGTTIWGISGVDQLTYMSKIADAHISQEEGLYKVRFSTGTDSLHDIERLQFSDYNVALDTDSANSAGGIYRLYQAAFDRQPDLPGLGYWIKAADNGKSAVTMAEDFTWSKEFLDLFHLSAPKDNYFTGVEVKTLVEGMYTHVLHRTADSGGLNYYAGVIQSHEKTVGRVLAEISDSPENHTAVASAIANGIQYTPYTAQAMTSLHVIDDVDGVVAEPQTMALDAYSTYSDQYQVDLIGQTHDPMLDWMWMG